MNQTACTPVIDERRRSRETTRADRVGCSRYLNSRLKRSMDVATAIILVLPVAAMILFLMLVVLAVDGWPPVIWQRRAGKAGCPFSMPKLRTMRRTSGGSSQDITTLGRVLRRFRLDELPQVFCVITGSMSLVGPRPELEETAATYGQRETERLIATPGITGLWQVRGRRDRPIHAQLRYDLLYLQRASLGLDMLLLVSTFRFLIHPKTTQL